MRKSGPENPPAGGGADQRGDGERAFLGGFAKMHDRGQSPQNRFGKGEALGRDEDDEGGDPDFLKHRQPD